MQDCASRETAICKALNFSNSYSRLGHPALPCVRYPCLRIRKSNNAGDGRLSSCPKGAKLEHQCCLHTWMYVIRFCLEQKICATLYKGISIIYPWSFKIREFEVNLKVYLKGA